MNRLDSLDWQRGLLALSIMIYHLTGWTLYYPDSSDLLGRLGIYGVAMFFVLSGLSMALVYNKYICDTRSSLKFFIRRVFRIWPLLWLAIFAAVFYKTLLNIDVSISRIALNLTTLFGFVSPSSYINNGAWSIGNEMVYYSLTPALILIYKKSRLLGNLVLVITVLIGIYFAFEVMSTEQKLRYQWFTYINPFNNLFFYCAGIAIYYNMSNMHLSKKIPAYLFFISSAIFLYYPAYGNQINLVTGINRIVFSIASILMVIAFYKSDLSLPKLMAIPLTQLGVATYGVYLLHPIIYQYLGIITNRLELALNPFVIISITAALTIAISLVSFKILEAPCIALGKRITA